MNIALELVPKEQTGLSSGFSITLGSMGVIVVPPSFGFNGRLYRRLYSGMAIYYCHHGGSIDTFNASYFRIS